MPFDTLSFIAGAIAGILTGVLASTVHRLEVLAELQEQLRDIAGKVDELKEQTKTSSGSELLHQSTQADLQRDLGVIQEEIRRMFKRSAR